MKKILLTSITIFIFALGTAKSQAYYKYAVGVRAGYPSGLTGKIFINDADAVEGIAHFYFGSGLGGTVLFEHHLNLLKVPALNIYFGGGLGVTSYNGAVHNISPYTDLSITGVVGVEYTFEDFPINVSFDLMPGISLVGDASVNPFIPNAGLSARYCF